LDILGNADPTPDWSDLYKSMRSSEEGLAQVQAKKTTSGLTGRRFPTRSSLRSAGTSWLLFVREAFGLLTDHSYDPSYPTPTAVEEPVAPGGWTGFGVSVKDLLTAELLTPGVLLPTTPPPGLPGPQQA
jgi:hypothetical protein